MREIKGNLCHQLLTKKITPALTYKEGADFEAWRNQVKEKLFELTGIDNIKQNACPLNVEIEKEVQKDGYKQIRFTFESEVGAFVPCYLLIPDGEKKKYPVAITLQGHSSGFHNSIAEPKEDASEAAKEYAYGRACIAVQAVKRGYVALAIEQRGMGERRPREKNQDGAQMCSYTAQIALLLGRTILGERMWDVSKAIDALSGFDCVDMDNIIITGGSGGGTASFYSACFDERIKVAAPVCAFCSYETSIMDLFHCSCNFIPHAYEWFEMQDLACLIAPRKLLVIAGKEDGIFPIHGVEKAYETVKKVFTKAEVPNHCKLVETPKGHWWCEDIVWDNISSLRGEN